VLLAQAVCTQALQLALRLASVAVEGQTPQVVEVAVEVAVVEVVEAAVVAAVVAALLSEGSREAVDNSHAGYPCLSTHHRVCRANLHQVHDSFSRVLQRDPHPSLLA
jgi:hypothetical protein